MDGDLVTIRNERSKDCGSIPDWVKERPNDGYFAYFENEHGKQWFLLATRNLVRMAGGDAGWDRTYELKHPDWKAVREDRLPAWPVVILNGHERAWVRLCLRTVAQRFW